MAYVLLFLAGMFGANGVPHFIKGITGEPHQTPFKKPSNPATNVAWGVANFYLASWLFYWAAQIKELAYGGASLAVTLGILTTGVILASYWAHNTQAKWNH